MQIGNVADVAQSEINADGNYEDLDGENPCMVILSADYRFFGRSRTERYANWHDSLV